MGYPLPDFVYLASDKRYNVGNQKTFMTAEIISSKHFGISHKKKLKKKRVREDKAATRCEASPLI